MILDEIEFNYNKYYSSIHFERLGLFQCIRDNFNPKNTVYIGSSIHISPSFFLQNTTYIDNSPLSKKFYSNMTEVLRFIEPRKTYRQRPMVNFLDLTFGEQKLKFKYGFDMALSIYSFNSLTNFPACLNKGGKLIYLPLKDNIPYTVPKDLDLYGFIYYQKGKYHFESSWNSDWLRNKKRVFKNDTFTEMNIYKVYIKKY